MWAAIINTFLGVWVMTSPAILDYEKEAANNNYIVGPLIITVAIIAIWEVNRSARYFNIVLGAWLAFSPFILASDSTVVSLNNILVGTCVVVFSMFKGKIEGRYGGGWRSLFRPDKLA